MFYSITPLIFLLSLCITLNFAVVTPFLPPSSTRSNSKPLSTARLLVKPFVYYGTTPSTFLDTISVASTDSTPRRLERLDSEQPDFYLFQPYSSDYIAFGYSVASASAFFGWSQNRYGWTTNNPNDVSDISSYKVSQYEYDLSTAVGESRKVTSPKIYYDYMTSMYNDKVLWAGGRGSVAIKYTADSSYFKRHRISQYGQPAKNIDIKIISCSMGTNYYVLGGYTFPEGDEATEIARVVKVYRLQSDNKFALEKTINPTSWSATAAKVVAAADGAFFIGDPGEKTVRGYIENVEQNNWSPGLMMKFGGLGETITSDGAAFGSSLAYTDGLLAVGAPSSIPHITHVPNQPDNAGSVFIYRVVINVSAKSLTVNLVIGINAPISYLQSHYVQSSGLLFGASVALSQKMLDNEIYLFAGAPGSVGSEITKASGFKFDGGGGAIVTFSITVPDQGLGTSKFTHWFTGFIGAADHDAGASVTYSHETSMLFYGAPHATNWPGSNKLYGSGRVYIAAFCKKNEESYSYKSRQQYLKKCKACSAGFFSNGGRERCDHCAHHSTPPGRKPTHAAWSISETCVWNCMSGYFGSNCVTCSQFKTNDALPTNAHWTSGQETCTWVCDEGYPLSTSSETCEEPTPPSAPSDVQLSLPTSSTLEVRWPTPTHDVRVPLSFFEFQVIDGSGSTIITHTILIPTYQQLIDGSSDLQGPLTALAPSGETGKWWKWTIPDLLASTTYTVKVRGRTASISGTYSSISNAISTSVVSAPSKLTNVTFISSAGGSISLNINRPKNLGGVPLSAITYVADVCLSDNTGNCEKSPLQNVIVTIDSIYRNKYIQVDVNGLLANNRYKIRLNSKSDSKSDSLSGLEWSDGIVAQTSKFPTAPATMNRPVLNQATSDTLHVQWVPPTSNGGSVLVGYRIYVYEAYDLNHHGINGTDFKKLILHTSIVPPYEKTITGLTARKQYSISISAYNKINRVAEESPLSLPIFTQAPISPTAPRNPVFTEVGSSWFQIQWRAPVDMGGAIATQYRIRLRRYIGDAPSSVVTLTVVPEGPDAFKLFRYRLTNLKAETQYDFSVSVSNIVGDSPFTAPSGYRVTNPVRIPGSPGLPVLELAGSDFVVVKWTTPEDDGGSPIESYNLYVSEDGTQWSDTSFATPPQNSYRFENLLASTVRWIYVTANNMAGTGVSSAVSAPLRTDIVGAPGSPASLILEAATATTLSIQWTAPTNDGGAPLSEYFLRVTTTSGLFIKETKVSASLLARVIVGLQIGTTYTITCSASNSAGHSGTPVSLPSVSTTNSPTVPSQPIDVHIVGPSSLEWSIPNDTGGAVRTKYVVSYVPTHQKDDANAWSTPGQNVAASASTFDLSTLNMPTTSVAYNLRIAAWNSIGAGAWSDSQVTLVAGLILSNLGYGIQTTSSSIQVTWTRPTGATRVDIVAKSVAPDGTIQSFTFTSTSPAGMTLSHLYADTEYTLSAFASTSENKNIICSTCDGPISVWPTTKTTPSPSVPAAPQNVRLQTARSTCLTLEWDPPTSTFGARNVTYYGGCYTTGNEDTSKIYDGDSGDSGSNTLTAHGLRANVDYNCYVVTRTEVGVSTKKYTTSYITTMGPSVPSAPYRPIVTDIQSGHVSLSFEPPSSDGGVPILNYIFQISSNGMTFENIAGDDSGYLLEVDTTTNPSLVTVTVKRLTALTHYYFRVSARNTQGTSLPSLAAPVTQTTVASVPSAPKDLVVTLDLEGTEGTRTLQVQWSAPDFHGGVQNIEYVVERNLLGLYGDACSIQSTIPGYNDEMKGKGMTINYDTINQNNLPTFARATSISDTNYEVVNNDDAIQSQPQLRTLTISIGVKYSALYVYRVRATNIVGGGTYSVRILVVTPVETTLQPAAPVYVPETYSTVQSPDDVLLSWEQPTIRGCSPFKYVLLRYTKLTSSTWDETPVRIDVGSTTVHRDAGLKHSTSYKWQLIATNLVGESEPSTFSTIITTGQSKPSEICRFEVHATAMDVVLDWDPPCDDGGASAPFPKYQVQFWRKDYGGNWNHLPDLPDGVTSYTHTFSREYFNQEFVFQVRATNKVGYGPWTRKTIKMLEPIICKGQIYSGTGIALTCSGHGDCHAFDGTCACESEYAGDDCKKINGVQLTMSIEGTIETFDPDVFRIRVAEILQINANRIPNKLMKFEAGSIVVQFAIIEENSANTTATTVTSSSALNILQTKLKAGDLFDLGAVSLRVDGNQGTVTGNNPDGSSSIAKAPSLPTCDDALTTDDPCGECSSRIGCGYCSGVVTSPSTSSSSSSSSSSSVRNTDTAKKEEVEKSPGTCMMGGTFGPAVGTGICPTDAWFYGQNTCPMTARATCAQHSNCGTCMVEDQANCAWCASSGTCLSQIDDRPNCPWGWVPDICVAKCDKDKRVSSTSGIMWLGSDRINSTLEYQPLTQCKWTLTPIMPPRNGYSSRSSAEDFSIAVIFERVDLGGGDSIKIYDGNNQLVEEFDAGTTEDRLPLTLSTSSGMYVVEFNSDAHSSGTGFLAKFEATATTFWDVYVVIAMSTISMTTLVCCFCCWMRCKTDDFEDVRPITNNMGMNLQSTERGASLANIQKFPKFYYTPQHLEVMHEIGHSETCTICLGDYEDAEQLRLLPCGHCFHAECVDAWLQINRICPMCKVDVYELYVQQEKQKAKNKKAHKKAHKNAKKIAKEQKKKNKKIKKNKKHAKAEIIPIDASNFSGTNNESGSIDDFFENTTLSPIEQFRSRSRRLLSVGNGRIIESRGETKTTAPVVATMLPEIEMSVLPSRNYQRAPQRAPQRSIDLVQQEEDLFAAGSNFMVNPTMGRIPNRTPNRTPNRHSLRPPPSGSSTAALSAYHQRRRSTSGDRPSRPLTLPSMPNIGGSSIRNPERVANLASFLNNNTPRQAANNRRRRSTIAEDDTLLSSAF